MVSSHFSLEPKRGAGLRLNTGRAAEQRWEQVGSCGGLQGEFCNSVAKV